MAKPILGVTIKRYTQNAKDKMNHITSTAQTDSLIFAWLLLLGIPALIILALVGRKLKVAALIAVIGGVGLQTFHSIEHVIQGYFWARDPLAPGYMSPLAKKAATGLESIASSTFGISGRSTLGMELLHLVGNTLFFLGIVALVIGAGFKAKQTAAKYALAFEGIHLLEHIALTATTVAGFPAWGSSTLYGNLSGSQLSTHRIMWHLVMNLAALALTLYAISSKGYSKSARWASAGTLISAGLLPVVLANIYGIPMSGYGTTIKIFDPSTLTALLANPIPITAILVLLGASTVRDGALIPANNTMENFTDHKKTNSEIITATTITEEKKIDTVIDPESGSSSK